MEWSPEGALTTTLQQLARMLQDMVIMAMDFSFYPLKKRVILHFNNDMIVGAINSSAANTNATINVEWF